jgi:hypothetical protein
MHPVHQLRVRQALPGSRHHAVDGLDGHAYDNAMAESFFASLEREVLNRRRFRSQAEARMAIFEWIEGWYSPHRRHSGLAYRSPVNYERAHHQARARMAELLPPSAADSLSGRWSRQHEEKITGLRHQPVHGNGSTPLMRAKSAAFARGATGDVKVFYGDGKGRISRHDELPELLKSLESGQVSVIEIIF